MCSPETIQMFEKGRKTMPRKDHTHGFPSAMPAVSIEKSTAPFFEVRCYDVLVNGNDRVFGIPILIQENAAEASGNTYIDRNGQVVLLRQYEWSENLAENDYYSDNDRDAMQENAVIVVNGDTYIHTEDRISEYVL